MQAEGITSKVDRNVLVFSTSNGIRAQPRGKLISKKV